jgi:serine/threonine protein phosphatase PrpC
VLRFERVHKFHFKLFLQRCDTNTTDVANVGDSRAVLCTGGKAVDMSIDHKPESKTERERIEALGGRVARSEQEAFPKDGGKSAVCKKLRKMMRCVTCMREEGPMRVYPGGLSVSRTIGDISMKATQLVIPDPDLRTHTITKDDEFLSEFARRCHAYSPLHSMSFPFPHLKLALFLSCLCMCTPFSNLTLAPVSNHVCTVLACDGVWDVMSSQDAVAKIRSIKDPTLASKVLANEALRLGSTDNISVVVVSLDKSHREVQARMIAQLEADAFANNGDVININF